MALIFPQRRPVDPLPANNPSLSRPILGSEERLGLRGFGRPRAVTPAGAAMPTAFLGGATSGDTFFVAREKSE